jgi:Asp-tRNA(Asn)/Glu-tRNA(Gln) amidotransferase A subunit family amidase
MALAWSYDKVGVLRVLDGEDGRDPGTLSVALVETGIVEPAVIRLGYREAWFDHGLDTDRLAPQAARDAGFELMPGNMPELDTDLLSALVVVEAASAFEELTLDGRDDTLRWQAPEAWPNSGHAARFEPAIGHIHARRLHRRLMIGFDRTMAGIAAILHPVSAGRLLSIGSHCGYPSITLPVDLLAQPTRTGFAEHVDITQLSKGEMLHQVPFGITLTGRLFEEPLLIAIAEMIDRRLPMLRHQRARKYRPR